MSTPTITKAVFDGYQIIRDADCDGTAERDVFPGPCRLLHIHVDNSANGAASFLKLYDSLAPVVGTTDPTEIYKIPASTSKGFPVNPDPTEPGLLFENGLSYACVTAGGTAGTTNPTSNVIVTLTVVPEEAS